MLHNPTVHLLLTPVLVSLPSFSQGNGFEGAPVTSVVPASIQGTAILDVDRDGARELLVVHPTTPSGNAVTALHETDHYTDLNGDAHSTEVLSPADQVIDIATFTNSATSSYGELLSVGPAGVQYWDLSVSPALPTQLQAWLGATAIETFTPTGGNITFVSVLEGGLVKTFALNGTVPMVVFPDTSFFGTVSDFTLLDWDNDGAPEIAAKTNFLGLATFLEVREVGGAHLYQNTLLSSDAMIGSVTNGSGADQVAVADIAAAGTHWELVVAGTSGVEPAVPFIGPISALDSGDHDGDGLGDIAVSNTSGLTLVYVQQAQGTPFSTTYSAPAPSTSMAVRAVMLEDLDGDGDDDIAIFDDGAVLTTAEAIPIDDGTKQFLVDPSATNQARDCNLSLTFDTSTFVGGVDDQPTHILIQLWRRQALLTPSGVVGGPIIEPVEYQLIEEPLPDPLPPLLSVDRTVVFPLVEAVGVYLTDIRLVRRENGQTVASYPALVADTELTFGNQCTPTMPFSVDRFARPDGGGIIRMGDGTGVVRGAFTPLPPEGPLPAPPPITGGG